MNALIPALLALAVLCLFPAGSFAKTAHRPAHKTAAKPVAKHQAHKKVTAAPVRESRTAKHHTAARPGVSRVREERASRRQPRHAVRAVAPEPRHETREIADSASRKATSSDFLRAAKEQPAPLLVIKAPSVEVRRPARRRRQEPAATPVPVVSVIRPAAQRPQLAPVQDEASTPVILPALYNKRGRLIVPPALRGSHEILIHQNMMADHDGLHRIQDDADLLDMRNHGLLVALPVSSALDVDDRLPVNRRYARPWTAQFLSTLARVHYAHFHDSIQVNSAVRTVEFQQHLIHVNGNAAPAEGDTASPHLTGQAIDIAKHGLSLTEIAWMRAYLLPLVQEGKIDVEEEFQQSCFHISVYKNYMPAGPKNYIASSHHNETSTLAAAVQ